MDLFDHAQTNDPTGRPFAEVVRPRTLDEIVGHTQVLGPGTLLRSAIERDRVGSLVLWGPPGTGKTTVARVIAEHTQRHFEPFSAVLGGVKEIRSLVAAARERRKMYRRGTILFVDEIHRFNKGQQDAMLPHVEDGTITLIGATTENPSFELNAALISRARIVVLERLTQADIRGLLKRAFDHPVRADRWPEATVDEAALDTLAELADGDARRALGALETALEHGGNIDQDSVAAALNRKVLTYDKSGDGHYQIVSAFIKAMRGTDPDGAVYWMQRMIESGEQPLFILRRMVVFASEDVGLADPHALPLVMAAVDAFRFIGLPEGMFTLIHAATYLACAPKSNTVLRTLAAARTAVKQHGNLPVPIHLRPGSTALMRGLGHGRDYRYPHEHDGTYAIQDARPDALRDTPLFEPRNVGAEAEIRALLARLRSESAE